MTMTANGDATDDEIDTELGERYYKNDKALEQRLTDQMTEIIRQFIGRRFEEGRRPALRDAHAQDNGCVRAIFRVDANIAPELRHGIFSEPGREYDAWIRFSNGNSEVLNSRVPDARGMAIKLMGVVGRKLLQDEEQTHDFIMANNPTFFVDDLQRYTDSLAIFHSGGYLRQFFAAFKLNPREAVQVVRVNLTWTTNPFYQQYWSMTPYRLGLASSNEKTAIKFSAKPRIGRKPSVFARFITYLTPGFSLKREMAGIVSSREMWFDFYIQRYADERSTPVEDTVTEWSETVSKPMYAAKIIIPAQEIDTPERNLLCENLSFSPWHSLPEHKPLGAVNRARKTIYLKMSEYRHRLNAIPKWEPWPKGD
jgi:Catalase